MVNIEHVENAYAILMNRMNEGCPVALKLFFEYAIGKPRDIDKMAMHNHKAMLETYRQITERADKRGLPREEVNAMLEKLSPEHTDLDSQIELNTKVLERAHKEDRDAAAAKAAMNELSMKERLKEYAEHERRLKYADFQDPDTLDFMKEFE
jgi:hypothetical protein